MLHKVNQSLTEILTLNQTWQVSFAFERKKQRMAVTRLYGLSDETGLTVNGQQLD